MSMDASHFLIELCELSELTLKGTVYVTFIHGQKAFLKRDYLHVLMSSTVILDQS